MKIFCKIVTDILHILGIYLVCKLYLVLDEKINDKYRYVKMIVISAISSYIILLIDNAYLSLPLYILCIVMVLHICFYERIIKIFICGLWVSIIVEIIAIISLYAVNVFKYLLPLSIDKYVENLIASSLVFAIIYFLGKVLEKISIRGIKDVDIKYIWIFTFILFADLIMLVFMLNVTLDEILVRNKVLYVVDYLAITIGVFIQIIAIIFLLVSRSIYKEKEEIIKQYLEEQVKHYEYLNEREKETKKFRHDIRNHIYFLNKLRKEGEDGDFDKYLEEIIEHVDNLGDSINVGNDIVNALLNKYYAEAKNKAIIMNVSGHFPNICNISAYHLCTIFSNLLSNAIEAAEKLKDNREIWVQCLFNAREIIIEIGNYYDNNQLDINKLNTVKDKKDYHGWGLQNVKDSVSQCSGLMDIDIRNNKFIVSLVLNNIVGNERNENSSY